MGPHPFFFTAIVILPYVLIASAFIWGVRAAFLSKSPIRFFFLCPLLGAFITTAIFAGWGQYSIATSRSSMAAVGYIFLPLYCIGVGLAGFVLFWSVLYLFRFGLERFGIVTSRLTSITPLAVAVLILLVTAFVVQYRISRHRLLVAAETGAGIHPVIDRAITTHDLQVLAKLARNPNASLPDLRRIYDTCKDQVTAKYPREYIVLFSLSRNPKIPPDILVSLSKCHASSIRIEVGRNPNTPVEILPELASDKERLVRMWVTTNPNISKELLLKLADDSDKIVRDYAQSNLRHRGFAKKPVDAATQQMMDLGRRAASGDLQAVDSIEEQHRQLYQGINYENDRLKVIANLKLMSAAFDVLGAEAGKSVEAMKALQYANSKPELRSFTPDAFGLAAAEGNQQAMDALLNYESNGWLLSSTVGAMRYPAKNNQPQAIDFLIGVLNNPRHQPLTFVAKQGLKGAADKGNEKAKAALVSRPPN